MPFMTQFLRGGGGATKAFYGNVTENRPICLITDGSHFELATVFNSLISLGL